MTPPKRLDKLICAAPAALLGCIAILMEWRAVYHNAPHLRIPGFICAGLSALLLLMAEDGDVVLLDPQPDARRELTRFTALSGKTWNPPALAGRYLVVRNDREAACYRLPVLEK